LTVSFDYIQIYNKKTPIHSSVKSETRNVTATYCGYGGLQAIASTIELSGVAKGGGWSGPPLAALLWGRHYGLWCCRL